MYTATLWPVEGPLLDGPEPCGEAVRAEPELAPAADGEGPLGRVAVHVASADVQAPRDLGDVEEPVLTQHRPGDGRGEVGRSQRRKRTGAPGERCGARPWRQLPRQLGPRGDLLDRRRGGR